MGSIQPIGFRAVSSSLGPSPSVSHCLGQRRPETSPDGHSPVEHPKLFMLRVATKMCVFNYLQPFPLKKKKNRKPVPILISTQMVSPSTKSRNSGGVRNDFRWKVSSKPRLTRYIMMVFKRIITFYMMVSLVVTTGPAIGMRARTSLAMNSFALHA